MGNRRRDTGDSRLGREKGETGDRRRFVNVIFRKCSAII